MLFCYYCIFLSFCIFSCEWRCLLRMHCKGRLTPRQHFSALITTTCQVWSHWIYPLRCHSWYINLGYDLDLWLLTFDLVHLQCITCDVLKLCTKFERNRAIRGGVIAIATLNMCYVLRSALGYFLPSLNFGNLSVPELQRLWCWYVMSLCDLDLWPADLESLWSSVVRKSQYGIWAKSNKPRLSYWRFSTFSPCNIRGWGTFTGGFSGVRGPNFIKLGDDIGRSALLNKFVSQSRAA